MNESRTFHNWSNDNWTLKNSNQEGQSQNEQQQKNYHYKNGQDKNPQHHSQIRQNKSKIVGNSQTVNLQYQEYDWKNEYIKLQFQLKDCEKQYEEKITNQLQEINYLKGEMHNLTQDLDQGFKEKQIQIENAEIKLEKFKTEAKEEIKRYQTLEVNYFSQIKQMQNKVNNLREKQEVTNLLLTQYQEQGLKYKSNINELTKQFNDKNNQILDLEQQFAKSNKDYDDQRIKCNSLKLIIQEHQDQLIIKDQTIKDLQTNIHYNQEYQEKFKKTQQELLETQNQNHILTNKNFNLSTENSNLKSQMLQLNQSKNEVIQQGQELIYKFKSQEEIVQQMTSFRKRFQEEKQALNNQISTLKEQVDQDNKIIQELRQKIKEYEANENFQMQSTTQLEQQLLDKIQSQWQSETEQFQNSIKKYNSLTQKLQNELSQKQESFKEESLVHFQNQDWQTENQKLQQLNQQQQDQIRDLQQNIQRLNKQISDKDSNTNLQNDLITQLKQQMNEYEKQYLDLRDKLYKINLQDKKLEEQNMNVKLYQSFLQLRSKFKIKEQESKMIVNEIEKILKPSAPIILLLSASLNSMQIIMKRLFPNQKLSPKFQKNYQVSLNCDIIDTEPFEFENIDIREKQIDQYKKVFQANPQNIYNMWISVKFERTDLMKQQIMLIYKYVEKLKIPITIIITDFQYSENKQNDQQHLRDKLKMFDTELVFLDNHQCSEQFLEELKHVLPQQNTLNYYPFTTTETIFEDIPIQQQKTQQQLFDFLKPK